MARIGAIVLFAAVAAVAACQPTTGPDDAATPTRSAASQLPPLSGSPQVSLAGNVVHITGTGQATTPDFDLPAGGATVAVSTCGSNQVIPFVTLYDSNQSMLGFIVDASYELTGLKGGKYHLLVSANPDCTWTIDLTPK